jgi:predicted aspartyl protease
MNAIKVCLLLPLFFIYMPLGYAANDNPSKIVAACLMIASKNYEIPPAVLVGIYGVEEGEVGKEYKFNNEIMLGTMKINQAFVPELAVEWSVSEDKAKSLLKDDFCTNVNVATWLLRGQLNESQSLSKSIALYYQKNKNVAESEGENFKAQVIEYMKQRDLIKEDIETELIDNHGVHEITARLNGKIEIDFVFDTGASEVSIPLDVFLTLVRTKTITNDDLLPSKSYVLADGDVKEQERFIIRELEVNGTKINNIEATVSEAGAPFLLGQSFLRKFPSIKIDYTKNTITLLKPE